MLENNTNNYDDRGLNSIEDSVDTSIQRHEDYIEKHERGLITAIRINIDNMIDNRNNNNQETKMGRKTTLWTF